MEMCDLGWFYGLTDIEQALVIGAFMIATLVAAKLMVDGTYPKRPPNQESSKCRMK